MVKDAPLTVPDIPSKGASLPMPNLDVGAVYICTMAQSCAAIISQNSDYDREAVEAVGYYIVRCVAEVGWERLQSHGIALN